MSKRVLLAEDEPNIVTSLSFLLDRAGFDVDICEQGPHALDSALSAPPDVMILDVMLPGLDGFEILRTLRGDPRGRDLPVIILTASRAQANTSAALPSASRSSQGSATSATPKSAGASRSVTSSSDAKVVCPRSQAMGPTA